MTLPFSPAYAVAFVLALVRASAWVVICPPFANKSIPAMAKAMKTRAAAGRRMIQSSHIVLLLRRT